MCHFLLKFGSWPIFFSHPHSAKSHPHSAGWDLAECGWYLADLWMRFSRVWMRFCRVVRASDSQCPIVATVLVRSQHPPTQWNLRGGRWNSVEYTTLKNQKKTFKQNVFLLFNFYFIIFSYSLCWKKTLCIYKRTRAIYLNLRLCLCDSKINTKRHLFCKGKRCLL
jgi:hypothetical protein